MTDAVGHAVRATYFYTAMADLAMLTRDEAYLAAVDRIWSNAIDRKHYLTGGVGASHRGEAFSEDFDLRNDGYCESCAGCGMTFWADRMSRIHHHAHYFDVQERTLYNNLLGAIELSGENFFYQNPLHSDKARYSWHGCPCCVGNIPRALLGIKDAMYAVDAEHTAVYVNHFVASEARLARIGNTALRIRQQTEYPWSGDVQFTLLPEHPAEFTLHIRIPDRTESKLYTVTPDTNEEFSFRLNGDAKTLAVNNGYVSLHRTWKSGDILELSLPMEIQRVHCDARVLANRGRVALIRGPLVYNLENVDHEHDVRDIVLAPEAPLTGTWKSELLGGVMVIEGEAASIDSEGNELVKLVAIPNYARLNRGGWTQVWIVEDPEQIVELPPEPTSVVKPIVREDLDQRTLDRVVIGERESEKSHKLTGSRTSAGVFRQFRWRHAGDGWFSYEMQVDPEAANVVLCTYWGSDVGNRQFSILVDDREIGHQTLNNNKPGEFFDVEYPIPPEMTRGKSHVTVKLQADQAAMAGGIFDLRIMRPAE
jgi:hypothetical protein